MDQPSGGPIGKSQALGKPNPVHTNAIPKSLLAFYCAWKCMLLLVAAASPGPGYDTSTQILLDQHAPAGTASQSWLAAVVQHFVARLTRWDAIYFVSSSKRGLVYEQEWAFSSAYATATSVIARVFPSASTSPIVSHALAGILLSHAAHYGAAIALYRLTYELIPSNNDTKRRIAFIASCLHILSPAGLFLSAPYAESTFAALNFWGMYCYLRSSRIHLTGYDDAIHAAFGMFAAGGSFGAASAIRGNGILSGLVLAWDALVCLPSLPNIIKQRQWPRLIRFTGILSGGFILACVYSITQTSAYLEFCTAGNTRPWCNSLYPSIYTWVQKHYWGVGFLKYWTLSNLPLFLLATPMLILLLATGYLALARTDLLSSVEKTAPAELATFEQTLARMGLPQFILALLAVTNFHIQIVNRISSGYPVWYIVLAIAMNTDCRKVEWVVRGAIMYAVIQGGLYASFMPPA